MRQPFIAGNWKMFKTVHDAVVHVKELRALVKDVRGVDIVVAPPATALHAVAEAARNSNIAVAGQHCHWEREGAFTGETSADMVREAGAEYVIVGHSERRTLFGETDHTVNLKMRAALKADLVPIVCIGETLEQRDAAQTLAVIDQQLQRGLDGASADQVAAMVVAYEPVWAIGTGRNATPEQAGEVHAPYPHTPPLVVWRRCGRSVPGHLRRQRETGKYRRAAGRRRRRRRARGRGQPGRHGICPHRDRRLRALSVARAPCPGH